MFLVPKETLLTEFLIEHKYSYNYQYLKKKELNYLLTGNKELMSIPSIYLHRFVEIMLKLSPYSKYPKLTIFCGKG